MPIIASESTRTRNPIPAGQYAAVCARIIDLGDQYSEMYGKTNRKVMICWEVPEDTIEIDGKPMPKMISKEYTLALGQKSALNSHRQYLLREITNSIVARTAKKIKRKTKIIAVYVVILLE